MHLVFNKYVHEPLIDIVLQKNNRFRVVSLHSYLSSLQVDEDKTIPVILKDFSRQGIYI